MMAPQIDWDKLKKELKKTEKKVNRDIEHVLGIKIDFDRLAMILAKEDKKEKKND